MRRRLNKLRSALKKEGLGAFLISNPVNVYYISGFKSSEASLLISPSGNYIITDFRYKEAAEKIPGFSLRLIKGSFKDTLITLIKDSEIKNAGFEGEYLPYARADMLKKVFKSAKARLEPVNNLVENIRLIKDEEEVEKIKRCISIAKKVINALKSKVGPGISEKGLAAEIDMLGRKHGSDRNAFDTIVAAGKNASMPHAAVTPKIITQGEAVLIDFGVTLDLYNCDLTRMFFLGKIPRFLYDIYIICKEAQRRAIEKIRPGVKASDIDKAARGYIASKGFGEFFVHSLGHGVGLSVHELPRISSKSDQVLKPNMVFTVEPGIYLEKKGGVRIEDMVRVTNKGCEVLTNDISK